MSVGAPASYPPGTHILADFWGVERVFDLSDIDRALREAAQASIATVLDVRLHGFGANKGITGIALLSESHISIHTWPERGFIALDIFMCGSCNPEEALESLRIFFKPLREDVSRHCRGQSK